jgi:hypothetical protein
LLGLRINPDPAKTVNAVEKILPPRLTPALQVSGGGVQMTTERLATLTTLQTGFRSFRLVFAVHQGTQEGKHLKPLVWLTTKGIFRHSSWLFDLTHPPNLPRHPSPWLSGVDL